MGAMSLLNQARFRRLADTLRKRTRDGASDADKFHVSERMILDYRPGTGLIRSNAFLRIASLAIGTFCSVDVLLKLFTWGADTHFGISREEVWDRFGMRDLVATVYFIDRGNIVEHTRFAMIALAAFVTVYAVTMLRSRSHTPDDRPPQLSFMLLLLTWVSVAASAFVPSFHRGYMHCGM